jgi:hypothetical protein
VDAARLERRTRVLDQEREGHGDVCVLDVEPTATYAR